MHGARRRAASEHPRGVPHPLGTLQHQGLVLRRQGEPLRQAVPRASSRSRARQSSDRRNADSRLRPVAAAKACCARSTSAARYRPRAPGRSRSPSAATGRACGAGPFLRSRGDRAPPQGLAEARRRKPRHRASRDRASGLLQSSGREVESESRGELQAAQDPRRVVLERGRVQSSQAAPFEVAQTAAGVEQTLAECRCQWNCQAVDGEVAASEIAGQRPGRHLRQRGGRDVALRADLRQIDPEAALRRELRGRGIADASAARCRTSRRDGAANGKAGRRRRRDRCRARSCPSQRSRTPPPIQ